MENSEEKKQYYLDLLREKIFNLLAGKTINEAQLKEVQDDKPISSDDVGSQRDDRERLEQEITNTEDLINEATRALEWATKNGFICAICRKPIEQDRLDADPASLTCKEHRDEEDTIEL